jgi:SAM-dependent methyltransferase
MKDQLIDKKELDRQSINLETVDCPRCNSDKSVIVSKGIDFNYAVPGEFFVSECKNCKLWFQNPRPQAEHVADLYPTDYSPHSKYTAETNIPGFKKKYLREKLGYMHLQNDPADSFDWRSLSIFNPLKDYFFRANLTPDFVPEGKLLEIGCASGARLVKLRKLGWKHVFGIELVAEAVEKARAEGLQVECGLIEDKINHYPDHYFDVIITSMVLEHFFNPFEVIERITKKIKPGGQLLFSTVVRDSIDGKLYGQHWAGFDFPRHMVYFKKKDVLDALRKDYANVRCYHQNAPIDFKRSSAWRISTGRGTILDKIMIKIAESAYFRLVGFSIAWLNLTTRISIHCTKGNL